ncbi:hypothetical protein [Microbacterium thalassium]|uniref:Uncharacterized protein n=1 Tax=Microbacterium thalassium TaxID=362649 RepID=A0A7X0FS58_9MICO|nr:hypothetical protein [Microbacterium thalassium]MBB6392077.1 hypothetical protein [Microbacterium thalassium]GLK24964.1 hypothetical protein GCM10017607_22820 [Microbacterium thalassium]
MSQRLLFSDSAAAADALTYSSRTAPLGDGAVRLRATGGVMAMTSAPLAPRGLLDPTPTVLGMRVLAVDPELECDLVVEASTLVRADDDPAAVVLPDSSVSAGWAGVAPPRAGWQQVGAFDAALLAERAQHGVTAVAGAMPENPGEDVVRQVRASIWGAPDAALDELPLGAAFAAYALGFLSGDESARVLTAASWTRITLERGHVLVRRPAASGLTAVRATGRSSA